MALFPASSAEILKISKTVTTSGANGNAPINNFSVSDYHIISAFTDDLDSKGYGVITIPFIAAGTWYLNFHTTVGFAIEDANETFDVTVYYVKA